MVLTIVPLNLDVTSPERTAVGDQEQSANIQVFETPEFQLRVGPDGESFRVEGPGLARALGFRDAYVLVRSIPEAEKGYTLTRTPGGEQKTWFVTEAGFYRAVGQRQVSRIKDPAARDRVARFQAWVYGEVLPSIRRTGGYRAAAAEAVSPIMARLAEVAHKQAVVPASGRILAFHRWHNTQKGVEAFGELCIQLELDFRPLGPGDGQGQLTDGAA
jgi:prophage antirepressor-like protein